MKMIPTEVEGERVLLRRLGMGDAGDMYKHIRSRDVARWTMALPHPYPKDGAAKFIRKIQRQWRAKTHFVFGIILKKTGKLIGGTGLNRVDFKHGCGELGYWLGKKYWGQGLMTEAVRLMLRFGFESLGLYRIYAHAFEPNAGSWRVMAKCGMVREGTWREAIVKHGKRQNLVQYSILEPEWRKRKNNIQNDLQRSNVKKGHDVYLSGRIGRFGI